MATNHWSGQPSTTAIKRLTKDYKDAQQNPIPGISIKPDPENILRCHYCIQGPKDSVYEGGYYYGKVVFPVDFPFWPPAMYMMTPSGRFDPGKSICTTNSHLEPRTWTPTWNISTILNGLCSFMLEEWESPIGFSGSIQADSITRKKLAKESGLYNLEKYPIFMELFPELASEILDEIERDG